MERRLRVDGRLDAVSVAEYARLVADQVASRVEIALEQVGGDAVLSKPEQVAESLIDVMNLPAAARVNDLAALLGPFWSAAKTRDVLGVRSRQAMGSRRKRGAILGLRTSDGVIVYPVWQFHRADGVIEVRPTLVPMLRALKHCDAWTVGVLLRTPAPELEGHTPLAWARAARSPEALHELACAVAREWSTGAA